MRSSGKMFRQNLHILKFHIDMLKPSSQYDADVDVDADDDAGR